MGGGGVRERGRQREGGLEIEEDKERGGRERGKKRERKKEGG
jgi:hypothetical protein